MFSRAVRWPVLRRRSTASGRAASAVGATRARSPAGSGRRAFSATGGEGSASLMGPEMLPRVAETMTEKASGADALMVTSRRFPAAMVEGRGSYLFDENGKRDLDFVQGWAGNCLGHAPAVVAEDAATPHRRLVHCGPLLHTPPRLQLSDV